MYILQIYWGFEYFYNLSCINLYIWNWRYYPNFALFFNRPSVSRVCCVLCLRVFLSINVNVLNISDLRLVSYISFCSVYSYQQSADNKIRDFYRRIKGGSPQGVWNKLEEVGLYLHGLNEEVVKFLFDKNTTYFTMQCCQFCTKWVSFL